VFVRGRLLYLLSVIPENGNSVSKSVVVDAARNKVVAIFDNDTDPTADQQTLRYLATGALDQAAIPQGDSGGQGATQPATRPAGNDRRPSRTRTGTPSDVQRRVKRLIQQQRDTLRETEQLRREIERGK
jgi:hypothetical protein